MDLRTLVVENWLIKVKTFWHRNACGVTFGGIASWGDFVAAQPGPRGMMGVLFPEILFMGSYYPPGFGCNKEALRNR